MTHTAFRSRLMRLGMSELWHGTRGGYTHHHCRCDECRAANAAYHRRYKGGWRDKLCKGPCETPGCGRRKSRAYAGSGLCGPCVAAKAAMKVT